MGSCQGLHFWKFGWRFNPHPSGLCSCPSPSHLLQSFHQVCCFTRNTLSTFFALIRLLQKIMHFQSKTNFLIQLTAGQFWFCCFVYMYFLGCFSTVLPSWNYKQFYVCIQSWVPIWPLIKSCGIKKELMGMVWKLHAIVIFRLPRKLSLRLILHP